MGNVIPKKLHIFFFKITLFSKNRLWTFFCCQKIKTICLWKMIGNFFVWKEL
jgi:hypothetical protein